MQTGTQLRYIVGSDIHIHEPTGDNYVMRDIKTLPNLLTADEVADYLRVSKTTVCRWFVHGKLPGFRIGRSWRVQRDDLELFIKQAQTVRELRQPTAEVDTIVPIIEQNAES